MTDATTMFLREKFLRQTLKEKQMNTFSGLGHDNNGITVQWWWEGVCVCVCVIFLGYQVAVSILSSMEHKSVGGYYMT